MSISGYCFVCILLRTTLKAHEHFYSQIVLPWLDWSRDSPTFRCSSNARCSSPSHLSFFSAIFSPSFLPSFSPRPPQPTHMQVVDQLYAHAAQWVDTSTIKSSACMMLGLPNAYGVWHDRFLVLTPWSVVDAYYCTLGMPLFRVDGYMCLFALLMKFQLIPA